MIDLSPLFWFKVHYIVLCLFEYSGPIHIVLFLCCFSSSCVPYVASFSWPSIFDCPFDVL